MVANRSGRRFRSSDGPSHGQRLQQAFTKAGANAELITLAGVDHTFAFQKAPDVYAAKVIPFLRQHLHTDTARD